jgi:HlyD family secretion protein
MTLSDLSKLFILAAVDESDIGKVEVEQSAFITADAFPGHTFHGKVVRIATRGMTSSNVVTFEVKLEVLGKNKSLLKPEMTANIEIVVARKDDVLMVPTEAISRKKGKRVVQVMKDKGVTEERVVEVGVSDGTKVEISSGLQEGETVVLRKEESESRWRRDPGGMNLRMMMGGGGGRGRK